jgi:hypothetical protein
MASTPLGSKSASTETSGCSNQLTPSERAELERFLPALRPMIRHVTKRYYRPDRDSTPDDYLQAMTLAVADEWRHRPTDAEERTAWLWRVLRRAAGRVRCADDRAMRQRQAVAEDMSLADTVADERTGEAVDACVLAETLRMTRAAVDQLPDLPRRVVGRLYGLDGLPAAGTIRQTATELGIVDADTRAAHVTALESIEFAVLEEVLP